MATLSITIPDAQANRVKDAFKAAYDYTEEDGPEAQFVKKKVIQFIKETVVAHESNAAREKAATTASEKVESEVALS